MADVFISYAHEDRPQVQRILDALMANERSFTIDDDIPATGVWREELTRFIERSTALVFMLSPNSLTSDGCLQELRDAHDLGKRIIVVWLAGDEIIISSLKHGDSPASPFIDPAHHILDFRDDDKFAEKLKHLLFAIDHDLALWRRLTDVLVKARDWETHALDRSRLLHGKELVEAQQVVDESFAKAIRPPDVLMRFLDVSRRRARTRLVATVSVLSATTGLLAIVAVLSLVLYQVQAAAAHQAVLDRDTALLSVYSQEALQNQRLDLALLLAVQANRTSDSAQTRQTLLTALTDSPHLQSYLYTHITRLSTMAPSTDSSSLFLGGRNGDLIEHDLLTGKETPFPQANALHVGDAVGAVIVSPDGTHIITYSDKSNGFLVWDVHRHALLGRLPIDTSIVGPLRMLSDGMHFVASVCAQPYDTLGAPGFRRCRQFAFQRWNILSGTTDFTQPLPQGTSAPDADHMPLAITPGGQLGVVDNPDTSTPSESTHHIQLWDIGTGQPVSPEIPFGTASTSIDVAAAFNPAGTSLALLGTCVFSDPLAGQFSVEQGCLPELDVFAVHGHQLLDGKPISLIGLAKPDGTLTVSQIQYGVDGTLYLVDEGSLYQVEQSPHGSENIYFVAATSLAGAHNPTISQVVFLPDGRHSVLRVSGQLVGQAELELLDLAQTDQLIHQVPSGPIGTWTSGAHLLGYRNDVGEGFWQAGAGAALWEQVTPDGRYQIGTPTSDRPGPQEIPIIDLSTNSPKYSIRLPVGESVYRSSSPSSSSLRPDLALGSDSNTVVVATNQNVFVWNIALGRVEHSFSVRNLASVRVNRTREVVAGVSVSDKSAALTVIELASGKVTSVALASNQAPINDVALSSDGLMVAALDDGGDIALWNTKTLKQLAHVATNGGFRGEAHIDFSPDGQLLASYGGTSLSLWSVAPAALYARFPAVPDMSTMVWTTQGTGVMWTDAARSRIWTLPTEPAVWRARACVLASRNLTRDEWTQFVGNVPYATICGQGQEA